MASTVDSEAVFVGRALAMGVPQPAVDSILQAGYRSMNAFAFSANWVPGAVDDTPFVNAVALMLGAAPDGFTLSSLRRLFFESYTLSASELRARIERTDESTPRRLPVPERLARYTQQVLQLPGLVLRDELEPSNALVDATCQQHEDNMLAWLPWESLTKRSQELVGCKRDPELRVDASGAVRLGSQVAPPLASLGSDLRIKYALQRRGLAYGQARLLDFALHDRWVERLICLVLRPPPVGYSQVDWAQACRADKELWHLMAEMCRSGIQALPDGTLPLNAAITACSLDPAVTHLLQPLPTARQGTSSTPASSSVTSLANSPSLSALRKQRKLASQARKAAAVAAPPPAAPQNWANTAPGKGKGKAKGAGKGAKTMLSTGPHGRICWGFNGAAGCQNPTSGTPPSCARGVHMCAKPGCGQLHSMVMCPLP